VARTWILQSNPKLYDIDLALQKRPVIYWRVPQFFEQLKTGDHTLIWRSGKQAGIIGWGVLLSDPQHYDLSGDDDPYAKTGFPREEADWYVPVRVWSGAEVPKQEVAEAIPENRIVTAPMGTVFVWTPTTSRR
jgi:EVE domain